MHRNMNRRVYLIKLESYVYGCLDYCKYYMLERVYVEENVEICVLV